MIFVSKQKIRKINYKSDFDFILDIKVCTGLDAEGNSEYAPLGFPDYDFEGGHPLRCQNPVLPVR